MTFLTSFLSDTRLLTSKHLKLISTYVVERNEAMSRTCFSEPQNAKKEHQLKHKNQVRNWCLIELGIRVWKIILVIRDWAKISQTITVIWIKIYIEFENICLHVTGYLNTKKSFPISMFVLMTSGKCDFHIYVFHLSMRILTCTNGK